MSEQHEIDYLLTIDVEDAMTKLRRAERLLFRTLSLVQRLSGDENLSNFINKLQEGIMVARTFQVAVNLMYTATGPVGWALAGISLATSAVVTADFASDLMYDSSRGH